MTDRHAPPHDSDADEPLGPLTPDDETDAGDTPEVHDAVTVHDFPKGTTTRRAAEDEARRSEDGLVHGDK
jgi:hypothetical protein